jgi:hypothetical protein
MTRRQRPVRYGNTLAAVLLALAIAAIPAGVAVTWLERARDDANRLTCANNLRQLVMATHRFHETNGTLPPYWGAYPDQDACSVKGSWFCHLLPYVGETGLYGDMMADIQKTGVNWDIAPPAAEEAIVVASARADSRDKSAAGTLQEVARYNGHRHLARMPEAGAGASETATARPAPGWSGTAVSTGIPPAGQTAPGGIFRPEISSRAFPLLQCPSDPSPDSYPDAGIGQVYRTRSQSWGSTNYLANWNAFANNNPQSGFLTPPQSFGTLTDGLASTVLFSEGYAWCDGKGRLALNSWDYHSFGLTWALDNATIDDGTGERQVDFPRGMPDTYLFQVRPLPRETADCPNGTDCCDNWRAQTGHFALNAAMADGSVREFGPGTSQKVWDHALLPRDGPIPGWDW